MSEHDLSPKGPFPGPQDALEFRGCGLNPCGDRLALSASLSAQAAEIERLTRERDEALARCGELAIDQITANNRATAAEAEAARLREALHGAALHLNIILSEIGGSPRRTVCACRSPRRAGGNAMTPRTGWASMSLLCALAGIVFTATAALGIAEREIQMHGLWLCVVGMAAGNRAMEFPK